jgi:hypothetical protein
MPNYKEIAITGKRWTRTNKITINIDTEGNATARFSEEEITVLDDGTVTNKPTETLPADIDPSIAQALIDKYLALADERDKRPPAEVLAEARTE